jgi:SAM-dependent methyltransferase
VSASETFSCPVCDGRCALLDSVDFNKSCEELRGKFLPRSGLAVSYVMCEDCGYSFAPQICRWSRDEFAQEIYNDEYRAVDPDWEEVRPRNNAAVLLQAFGNRAPAIRHLDYGGGNGLLARMLSGAGWNSLSYDPYVDRDRRLADLGSFDLVTAFEVFEHVPDVRRLMDDLASLVAEDGVVLFSTLLSDGNIAPGLPLTWWYAAPRNGHISLYSSRSLAFLGAAAGFNFGSLQPNFHAFWKTVPAWAAHLLPVA